MAHTRRPPSLRHKLGEKLKLPGSVPPRSPSTTQSTWHLSKSTSSGIINDTAINNNNNTNGSNSKSNSPFRRVRLCCGNVWRARRRIYLLLGIAVALYLWFKTHTLFSSSGGDGTRSFLRQSPKKDNSAEEDAWKQLVEAQPTHEHVNIIPSQLNNGENVEQPS